MLKYPSLVSVLTACLRGIRWRGWSKTQPRGHWTLMPRGWGRRPDRRWRM